MGSNKNRKPLLYLQDMYCYKDDSSRQPKTKKSFGHPDVVDTTPYSIYTSHGLFEYGLFRFYTRKFKCSFYIYMWFILFYSDWFNCMKVLHPRGFFSLSTNRIWSWLKLHLHLYRLLATTTKYIININFTYLKSNKFWKFGLLKITIDRDISR